jgi:cell wall-associated NlpC family hydrolase
MLRTLLCLRRGAAPYVLIGTLAAFAAAVPAHANPPSLDSKRAQAQQVLNEVNSLNANLGRADELLNLANLRLARVQREIKTNRYELRVAKQNLARSRRTIAHRLVTLYMGTSNSSLELILGARSLDDILNQLDTENRVSSLDAQVIGQVESFKAAVKVHAKKLAVARRQVDRLVATRRQQEHAIAARLGERRRLLSSLNGEVQRLLRAQQAAQLIASQRARQHFDEAQGQQAYANSGLGAAGLTPEGASVIPPSAYTGAAGVALSYVGTPYVWAGSAPGGFDCSGLVMYAYAQVGVSLPHSSYAMYNYGVPVPRDQLQVGDLVFFNGLGHVGIYIGGGYFVHAPHTGDVVKVSSLDADSYYGARRIL